MTNVSDGRGLFSQNGDMPVSPIYTSEWAKVFKFRVWQWVATV